MTGVLDLARDAPEPVAGRRAFAVIWHGDLPLGHLELEPDDVPSPARLTQAIARSTLLNCAPTSIRVNRLSGYRPVVNACLTM